MYLQSAVYEARDNYTMGHMDFEAKLRIKHIELWNPKFLVKLPSLPNTAFFVVLTDEY